MAKEKQLPVPIFITLNQAFSYLENDFNSTTEKNLKLREKWFSQVSQVAQEAGFVVTNVDDYMKRKVWSFNELAVNEFDGHPSPLLNVFYAERLYETIIQEKERLGLSGLKLLASRQ